MIYTVTLNPAIDYVMHTGELCPGGITRSEYEEYFIGGKGINVSVMLKTLGADSTALGFVAGFTGQLICDYLKEIGIKEDFIRLSSGFTRINVKLKSSLESEINGAGPTVSQDDTKNISEKLVGALNDDWIVISGSAPKNSPDDIFEQTVCAASRTPAKTVIDCSGDKLIPLLKYRPFLIKPNHHELSQAVGEDVTDHRSAAAAAEKLRSLGAQNVLVSMAGDGAVLVCDEGVFSVKAPKGELKNSVGAGDSMVAGFIAGYIGTGNFENALRLACAAGSATAFSPGLAEKSLIDRLIKEI